MLVPLEVGLDGEAQVFDGVFWGSLQMRAVEVVVVGDGVRVDWDGENLTLVRVELHQPITFPLADAVDVLLQFGAIALSFDGFLYDAVVCKEANGTVLSSRW